MIKDKMSIVQTHPIFSTGKNAGKLEKQENSLMK